MSYALNTSGHVPHLAPNGDPIICGGVSWPDLSPFTQGYIEALFAAVNAPFECKAECLAPCDDCLDANPRKAFSDLAPETLARIIADCEQQSAVYSDRTPDQIDGGIFWDGRKNNVLRGRGFPPLTVHLGGDGKVRFTTPARSEERRAGE